MNKDVLKGQWKQLRGEIKTQWGRLTDDDLSVISGNADKLTGTLQERYGYSRAQAEREIDHFLSQFNGGEERARRQVHEVKQDVQQTGQKVMARARETAADVRPDLERARRDLEQTGHRVAADVRDTATMAAEEVEQAGQKAVATARETVADRPLLSVGAALALGALLGLAIALIIGIGRSND